MEEGCQRIFPSTDFVDEINNILCDFGKRYSGLFNVCFNSIFRLGMLVGSFDGSLIPVEVALCLGQ